jgi:hypothetical protein
MKRIKILLTFLFTAALFANSYAQTVDEVIDNHIKALGGMDKLNAIKTVKLTGKFSGGGFDAPITMYIKRPNEARMTISFQGQDLIRATDGTTGWEVSPFNGKKDATKMPSEEVKEMKQQAEIEGQLVNYKDKGSKAELMGKEDMEGSEVYKIKLTDKDGDVTYYYLDAAPGPTQYLVLKDASKRKVKEKEISSETYYGNYQSIEGVMFPMAMEFKQPGSGDSQKGVMDKIEVNVPIDETIFKMPEATK